MMMMMMMMMRILKMIVMAKMIVASQCTMTMMVVEQSCVRVSSTHTHTAQLSSSPLSYLMWEVAMEQASCLCRVLVAFSNSSSVVTRGSTSCMGASHRP